MTSRRLRFEILRRDGYACRYCGAQAPDVKLTVDHVIPVAVGGGDEATNLVTSCADCNSGKSSTVPDSPIVEDVDATALLFARAMDRAIELRLSELSRLDDTVDIFDVSWCGWRTPGEEAVPRDQNWRSSIERFLAAGLTISDLERFIAVTMGSKVYSSKAWRYFCGCCWNEISRRQELARTLIENEEV